MPKLLIVDDDDNNRAVIADALENEEYELAEAVDGRDCLRQAADTPFDLILLDVMMPGIDGIETLRCLKTDAATRDIPVVMVTALNMDSQVAACLDEGAIDHISKPFSSMVLRARVRAAIRSQRQRAESSDYSRPRGRVWGLLGAKGGVGTTTIAVNLAAKLAQVGKTVTLCELQTASRSAAVQLGIKLPQAVDALLDNNGGRPNRPRLQQCLLRHPSGLSLLPDVLSATAAETLATDTIPELLQAMRGLSQYAILDLGQGIAEWTRDTLREVDHVLLVLEMEPVALRAACEKLKQLAGQGIQVAGALANSRVQLPTPAVGLNELREQLDCELLSVIPADPEGCFAGIKMGNPIVLCRPQSTMAGALSALANRLCTEPALAAV